MSELQAINPANGDVVGRYPVHTADEVESRIQSAHRTFESWSRVPIEKRAEMIVGLAALIEATKQRSAEMITAEMGKPIKEAIAEVEKCALMCRYYAENGPAFLADEMVPTQAYRSMIAFEPIGVVLAVMPWNFPFWQVLRFAVPALLAGNTGLLKHASNVPGSALGVEALFREAGFPEGVFHTLLVSSKQVDAVIEHPLVRAATLTGSLPAGRAIAAKAGACLKKTVMELGGSDPFVVLADANLDKAAEAGAQGRLFNTGQACIAAKRFIVEERIADAFMEKFSARMAARVCGDPTQMSSDLGPMARADLRNELHQQVEESVSRGATLHTVGSIPNSPGAYYPASILTDVARGMPAFDDELFGPVASIIRVPNEAEAIRVANDTSFGLGAAVFTEDLEKGERIAKHELQAGVCFVNDFVKSDPRLPFGGIKESGYGRELSAFGIREFVNIKTVVVA